MRNPEAGAIQLVLFVEDFPPVAVSMQARRIDERLAAVEELRGFTPEDRRSVETQMGGRLYAYEILAGIDAQHELEKQLASEVLWLAVNHYAQDGMIRLAIEEAIDWCGTAVVSIIITRPPGRQPGTSWSIVVGSKPHGNVDDLPKHNNKTPEIFGVLKDPVLAQA